jgi:hypothetical protein
MDISIVNPLNAELNPICHLLASLGGATIVVVSRLRVNGEIRTQQIIRVFGQNVKVWNVVEEEAHRNFCEF